MFGLHKRIICHKLNLGIKVLKKSTSFFRGLVQYHLLQRSLSASCDTLKYKRVCPEHYDHVLEHLRRNFFPEEPTNKAAGLSQQGLAELEEKAREALQDRMSLMAVDPQLDSCKIAGVVLNSILRAGDIARALEELEKSCDPGFRKMFTMLYCHNIKNDLFKEFAVDCIFEVRILSVDSSYRGRGIANELVKQSVALAKEKGFSMLKADATGIYSQKIFHSLGFEVFAEQPYDKYTDDDGQIILPVEAPHTKLELVYKRICEGTEEEEKLAKTKGD